MRKHLVRTLVTITVVLLLAVFAVFMITQTDWGRGQVRKRILALLQENSHGIVRMGPVTGNLLNGFTVNDLVVTDSSGAPFIKIDSLSAGWGLNTLRQKHIELDNVRVVRPIIVLDRKPGEKWNYDRIFPRDTVTTRGRKTGWLTWLRFTNMTIVDGDLSLASPWAVNAKLTGAAAAAALKLALSEEGRYRLRVVPGGYQRVSTFHHIQARIPLLRLEDPAYKTRFADIAFASAIAEPFKPPLIEVKSLVGKFEFTPDSVWWTSARVVLPNSRLAGSGRYDVDTNNLRLRLRADPVAAADLRWVSPRIPEKGTGSLDFNLDWVADTSSYVARNADVQLADAHLRGNLGLTMTDTWFILHKTDFRFTNLDTRLIQRLFPLVKPPRQGILNGRMALEGEQKSLDVNADVTFDERRSGRSHVLAVGKVGFGKGFVNATNLRVTMRPLQMDLAKSMAPKLPIGGTLTGTAILNGSTTSRMVARGDVTLVERGNVSRLTGTTTVRNPTGGLLASSWFDFDGRLHPLSLVTAGRFFPSAGLRGSASGPLRLTGTTRNLAVRTSLAFQDGGSASLTGRLDLASRQTGYDVVMTMNLFNANTILAKAPRTSLTGTVTAAGRGVDPATMNARVAADLKSSSYDTLSVNSAVVRFAAANGIARIDTLAVEVPEGVANASGTFGLARGKSGELRYHVAIDSLSRLAGLLPKQAGEVPPRPGILAQRISRAQADSARIDKATELQRAISGKAPVQRAAVDTPRVVNRQELSGSFRADGVATGNIHSFGAAGTASGANIVALGNTVQKFGADYSWTNALTPQSRVTVNANATGLVASGFTLDSVQAKVSYQKPLGTIAIDIHQDTQNSYSANADFTLDKARNELRLNDLKLRFDTTVWASTHPSGIHWGPAGIDVDKLELRNNRTGRIFVNGLIPKQGAANLEVAVDNFAVEDIISLAQSDINAKGLVSFDVHASGSAADPTLRGAFGTQNLIYNGTTVPETHGTISYANQTLTGRAEAMRAGEVPFFTASGTIPINLAFTGVTGSRFPTNRQIDLAIKADSLPLDLIPQVNTIVTNLTGHAVADFKVGGTLSHPEVTGNFVLDNAKARFVPLGLNLTGIDGSIRMLKDTIVIDSLVATSGGRISLTGGLGIGSMRNPSFDLELHANNALVLKNDKGTLTANIDLTMVGPFAQAYVSGSVRMLDGVLWVPESNGKTVIAANDPALFSVLDTAVASNKEIFPAQSPLLANLRMDVNLRVDRDVFVRSRDANVEVYSDGDLAIHVNRAKQALTLDGVLLSERGEYRFLTKRFQIKRGSATFVNIGELNPTLQITGAYEVRLPSREAINIEILIGGTLLNPRISLQSDAQPPIPQSDLLSYLAFGRSSSSLLQLEASGVGSSNNLIGAGAALATKQLAGVAIGVVADQAAGEAARSLGADVFNITPADVQTDVGSFLRGTEIEFGKYIKSHTFVSAQVRPDPSALKRPGLFLQHRFGGLRGYRLETSFEPRFLLREPSLALQTPTTTSVLGMFLIREWRF